MDAKKQGRCGCVGLHSACTPTFIGEKPRLSRHNCLPHRVRGRAPDFSIADYLNFYDKTFAPLKIKPELQLDKQTDIYQSEDDLPSNAQENAESEDSDDDSNSYPDDNNTDNNDDEWYDVE